MEWPTLPWKSGEHIWIAALAASCQLLSLAGGEESNGIYTSRQKSRGRQRFFSKLNKSPDSGSHKVWQDYVWCVYLWGRERKRDPNRTVLKCPGCSSRIKCDLTNSEATERKLQINTSAQYIWENHLRCPSHAVWAEVTGTQRRGCIRQKSVNNNYITQHWKACRCHNLVFTSERACSF